MFDDYIEYQKRNKIRLILMLTGIAVLIIVIAVLFVFIVQRNQSHNAVLISSGVTSSNSVSSAVSSGGTSSLIDESAQLKDWRLVLVNPTHKVPDNFNLQLVKDFDTDMDKRIVQPYTDMYKAALLDHISLWISCAYRSPQVQSELYKREIANNLRDGMSSSKARLEAAIAVALPYYSEHNTGLAMDLNGVKPDFDKSKEFAWLQKNAAEYGFVLRYPKDKVNITKIMYEPWHYRYVGPEHAKKMNQLHMCLEEYVEYLKKNSQD